MKHALSSLSFTRWLRVVAIAGVVLAATASTDAGAAENTKSPSSQSTRNSWCPRC